MEDTIIKIDGVGKKYKLGKLDFSSLKDINCGGNEKELWALKDVSVNISRGERLGIIGANGAGKSTLLKLISGITRPTEGKILLNGKVTSMLEVGTGFHPELTGRENIYMNGVMLGMKKKEVDEKLSEIIEFSECEEFIDTPVKRYSSGMYVKLAFAVAAHLESDIIILDEVLAVGDVKYQKKCLEKINELAESKNRTILFVSHNLDVIKRVCDRCLVLDKGEVVFDGNADDAIGFYFGDKKACEVSLDLSNERRFPWLQRSDARFQRVEYKDIDKAVFDHAGGMELNFCWKYNSNLENLSLRVEVRDISDSPIGVASTKEIFSGQVGELETLSVRMNIALLAPGKYKTIYTLYQVDGSGNSVDIDCVNGLDFEVIWDDSTLKWKGQSWGSVSLPELDIL